MEQPDPQVVQTATGISLAVGALIGAFVWQLYAFVRRLSTKEFGSALNQLGTWVTGIVVVMILAWAGITNQFDINGTQLRDLDFGSVVVIGILATSLFAMVPFNVVQAINNRTSYQLPNPFAKLNRAEPVAFESPPDATADPRV